MYSFRMSFLDGAAHFIERHALFFRDGEVKTQESRCGRVDRHRRRYLVERDSVEQRVHVVDGVDRHSDLSDLPGRKLVIRIQTDLRRQIERDAQSCRSLREKIFVTGIRFLRGREPGILPHRPEPAAVHVRFDTARVRELTGLA
jgi:hypothetical protein